MPSFVRLVCPVPSVFIDKIWKPPEPLLPAKAIFVPSGDQTGCCAPLAMLVNCVLFVPSRLAVHICEMPLDAAVWKAIFLPSDENDAKPTTVEGAFATSPYCPPSKPM